MIGQSAELVLLHVYNGMVGDCHIEKGAQNIENLLFFVVTQYMVLKLSLGWIMAAINSFY